MRTTVAAIMVKTETYAAGDTNGPADLILLAFGASGEGLVYSSAVDYLQAGVSEESQTVSLFALVVHPVFRPLPLFLRHQGTYFIVLAQVFLCGYLHSALFGFIGAEEFGGGKEFDLKGG